MLLLLLLLLLLLMLVLLLLILLPMLRRLGHWVVRDTRGRGTRGAQVAAVIGDRFWLRVEVYIQKNQRDVFDSTPKTRLTLTVWAPGSVAAHQCAVWGCLPMNSSWGSRESMHSGRRRQYFPFKSRKPNIKKKTRTSMVCNGGGEASAKNHWEKDGGRGE
jgi:hypothetical protein